MPKLVRHAGFSSLWPQLLRWGELIFYLTGTWDPGLSHGIGIVGIPFMRVCLNRITDPAACICRTLMSAVLKIRRESSSSKPTTEWKQRGFGSCLSPLQVRFGVVRGGYHSYQRRNKWTCVWRISKLTPGVINKCARNDSDPRVVTGTPCTR